MTGYLVLAAIATAASLALAVSAAGAHGPGTPRGVKVGGGNRGAKRTSEYWTRARMRRAKPVDPSLPGAAPKPTTQDPPKGSGPTVAIPGAPPASGKVPTSRKRTYVPYADFQVADPTSYPQVTNGKVFFRERKRGHHRHKWAHYVCSGTVVNSQNARLVFTAGHCVYDAEELQRWSSKFVFVPGYVDGYRPYGSFTASELWSMNGWINNANFNYDVGVAIMRDPVAQAVGSRGIIWSADANQTYASFGYPAASPFDGESLWVCVSPYGGDDPQQFGSPGPPTTRLGCDQTGGASGGGWIVGDGYLDGVHSYGYNDDPGVIYGPYFGDAVGALYNKLGVR